MMLRFLAAAALCCPQDPPKPPDAGGTPPAKPAVEEFVPIPPQAMQRNLPDGVSLNADFYAPPFGTEGRPTFVCFHMENGSRGEFAKIAPRLNEFACGILAVDLRTGKATDGVPNATATSAASVLGKKEFTNEEAFVDVVEALKWARELQPTGPVYALGSGTSAALVLVAAARDPACADAVFVFSPNEDVPGWQVASEVRKIKVPTYVTCDGSPAEAQRARLIGNGIDKKLRRVVIPTGTPGAKRGAAVLVQSDMALRDRHWLGIVKLILELAPLKAAEAPPKQG